MVEHQDDREARISAIDIIDQYGAEALNHVIGLITAAIRDGDDDAVRQLDRVMRYIERHR